MQDLKHEDAPLCFQHWKYKAQLEIRVAYTVITYVIKNSIVAIY
jgi:hypothetical protein